MIDITFVDTNNTAFAYCKPGRCKILIIPREIETRPSLHWIKRLENSAGSLVLNEIQMDDDGRKIIIKMQTTETAREETLMIRVTASQGNHLTCHFQYYRKIKTRVRPWVPEVIFVWLARSA